jgi:hypothetical protein
VALALAVLHYVVLHLVGQRCAELHYVAQNRHL